jgi:hypothetical protein
MIVQLHLLRFIFVQAEADDELNFKAGDIVEVIETSDDGWWKGKAHGKVGLFPVNYVQQM